MARIVRLPPDARCLSNRLSIGGTESFLAQMSDGSGSRLSLPVATLDDHRSCRSDPVLSSRRQATLLEAVASQTTDAVYAKDCDGRYLLFNAASSA